MKLKGYKPQDIDQVLKNVAPPKQNKMILVAAVVAILIVIGAIAVVSVGGKASDKSNKVFKTSDTTQAAGVEVKTETSDGSLQKMLDFAKNYAAESIESGENYDLAVANFDKIKKLAPGSKFEMIADLEIAKIKKAKSQALNDILDELRSQADLFAQDNKYNKAVGVFKNYKGKLALATVEKRRKLTEEYQQKAQKESIKKAKEVEKAQQEKKLVLCIAAMLTKGRFKKALKTFKESFPSNQLYASVGMTLKRLAHMDDAIISSYKKEVGKVVELLTRTGILKGKLKKIKGKTLYIEGKFKVVTVISKFNISDLTVDEKIKRANLDNSAKAVFKGAEFLKENKYTAAEKAFSKAGSPLAGAFAHIDT